MQLTPHFTLEEFTRSDKAKTLGISNEPPPEVVENLRLLCVNVLEPVRVKLGEVIHVNSGYRSPDLNSAVGGVATSHHVTGQAADIELGDCTPESNKRLFEAIRDGEGHWTQLIDERNYGWVHVSYVSGNLKRQVLHLK